MKRKEYIQQYSLSRNVFVRNSASAESEENEDGMVTHRPRMLKNAAEVAKLDGRVDKMRAG